MTEKACMPAVSREPWRIQETREQFKGTPFQEAALMVAHRLQLLEDRNRLERDAAELPIKALELQLSQLRLKKDVHKYQGLANAPPEKKAMWDGFVSELGTIQEKEAQHSGHAGIAPLRMGLPGKKKRVGLKPPRLAMASVPAGFGGGHTGH